MMSEKKTMLESSPANSSDRSFSKPKSLLIVEDDPDQTLLIDRSIRALYPDIIVRSAQTVHEAMMMIDGKPAFDIILADFMLADSRNGYELLHLCEDDDENTDFVLMSAMPLEFHESSGCPFVQKPFAPEEIQQVVTGLLSAS